MTVFLFRRDHLEAPVPGPDEGHFDQEVLAAAIAAVEHEAFEELTPIVLRDDWEFDQAVIDFAADVRRLERSPLTAEAYAREAEVFARYLMQVRGKSLAEVTEDDFWTYRKYRLDGPPPIRLRERSWNKACAALLRLKAHLGLDFPHLNWRRFRASVQDDGLVRAISVSDYLRFRTDGMMASQRSPQRNGAFSEYLVTTGCRRTEAAWLLRCELPMPMQFMERRTVEVKLPSAITKGNRERTIHYSKRVAKDYVEAYVSEERSHFVHRAIEREFPKRRYTATELDRLGPYVFFISEASSKIEVVAGWACKGAIPTSKLSIEERQRLIELRRVPGRQLYEVVDVGGLWVSEQGTPLSPSGWNAVFRSACNRAHREQLLRLEVTPHMLRHTFAVHYLSLQLKSLIEGRRSLSRLDRRGEVYDRIVADPLRKLQQRLGHRDITSTYKYLNYIEDNQELVDRIFAEWETQIHGS